MPKNSLKYTKKETKMNSLQKLTEKERTMSYHLAPKYNPGQEYMASVRLITKHLQTIIEYLSS